MIIRSGLSGARLTKLEVINNTKGNVRRAFRSENTTNLPFQEIYYSEVNPHTFKGWKLHTLQTQNLSVAFGEILIICILKNQFEIVYEEFEMDSGENHSVLSIPPNVFYALVNRSRNKSILLNATDIVHDINEGSSLPINQIEFKSIVEKFGFENEI